MLFLLMSFTFTSFGVYLLGVLVPKLSGYTSAQIQAITTESPQALIRTSVLVIGLLGLLRHLLTAGVFGYLTHPRPFPYLGLSRPERPMHILLAIGIMMGSIPVLEYIQELMRYIDFGQAVRNSQAESESFMRAILTIHTTPDFLLTLLAVAIVPAVGEELFFRGVLMKFMAKATRNNMWFAILFTALFFAGVHSNPYGMFSIFLAGALLGVIYYKTGSLWPSIIAHLCFNATQIGLAFGAEQNTALKRFVASDHMPLWLVGAGLAVAVSCLLLLLKSESPLKPSWINDFDATEDDAPGIFPPQS
jgi:uncharacterized protein